MAPIMPQASLIAQDLDIAKNWEVDMKLSHDPHYVFVQKVFDISSIIVS